MATHKRYGGRCHLGNRRLCEFWKHGDRRQDRHHLRLQRRVVLRLYALLHRDYMDGLRQQCQHENLCREEFVKNDVEKVVSRIHENLEYKSFPMANGIVTASVCSKVRAASHLQASVMALSRRNILPRNSSHRIL